MLLVTSCYCTFLQEAELFHDLITLESKDYIPNTEEFDCPICFESITKGDGVMLRECLHNFCM